jgi:hypothetical protein
MPFVEGKSGNPLGRPKGTVDRRNKYRKFLEDKADDLIRTLVEMALNKEPTAMKLCIERLIPKLKGSTINLQVPDNLNNQSIMRLGEQVLQKIASEEMTLEEGKEMFQLIESHTRIVVAQELQKDYESLLADMKQWKEEKAVSINANLTRSVKDEKGKNEERSKESC